MDVVKGDVGLIAITLEKDCDQTAMGLMLTYGMISITLRFTRLKFI
jgi:hypothetical protein